MRIFNCGHAATLTYDPAALDFFSFRVQLRARSSPQTAGVCDRGLELVASAVEEFGVDFRDMRASATDVDLIKVRRRR